MKVFVTGATGFVGQEVMRHLIQAGHSIRFLTPHPGSNVARQFEALDKAQAVPGDLDSAPLRDSMTGMDAVIHLVGIISEVGAKTFENIHSLGTANVVAAAQGAKLKKFVHMSALGTRKDAISRYHKSKWAGEETVRQSGLDYTIFRPSLIYGPKDHFVNLFAKIIRWSPIVPVLGRADAKFQPVPVADVATCFVKALTVPQSTASTFDLCGFETMTMPELLDKILAAMGRHRLKLNVPLVIARIQAAFLEFLYPVLLRKAPPLNRDQLIMLQEDNIGNGEPARALFGLKQNSFQQDIASYLGEKR